VVNRNKEKEEKVGFSAVEDAAQKTSNEARRTSSLPLALIGS
jgi:hypothetical protein